MRKTLGIVAALVAVTSLIFHAPGPAAAADAGPVSFQSYGQGDVDIRGMYGTASYFFALPPGTRVNGPVGVDLDFSHSALLLADRSTVTMRVNDVSLASAFLTPENRSHGHLTVGVPPEIVGDEGLFVEARFFMRLTRDDCEEPTNPALWATVHGSSLVALPTSFAGPRDLADVPALVVPDRVTSPPLTLVVQPNPDPDVLAAAGVVAAHAGRWLGDAGRDVVITTATEAPSDAPSILIGAGLEVGSLATATAANGVLAVSQDGPVRLIVTGADPAAVLQAANRLATIDQLHGPAVVLTGVSPAADPERTAPWTKDAASFAQLGIDQQEVSGPGTKTLNLNIERPAEWKLIKNGRLRLRIDTAPGVRRGPSYVQATANGFDLGTRKLTPGGGAHNYDFKIPGGLVDRDLRGRPKRAMRLQLRVHLAPEQQRCTPLDVDATKATILPTSSVLLHHSDGARFELGRFPASLNTAGSLVVVDGTASESLAAGVQMAASIGRWSTAVPALVNASEVSSRRLSAANVVLLGNADKALKKPVALAAKPVGASADDVVAFAGLVPSPFKSSFTALVIHGSDAGVLATARFLGTLAGVESIAGTRAAVISTAPNAQILQAESGAAPPVELAPVAQKSRIRNETIVGAVILAAFLLTVLLVIRYRWRPRRAR